MYKLTLLDINCLGDAVAAYATAVHEVSSSILGRNKRLYDLQIFISKIGYFLYFLWIPCVYLQNSVQIGTF